MQKNSIMFMLLLIHAMIQARLGCLDNSYHLCCPNDPKEEHYVCCYCLCERRWPIAQDGTCTNCYHRRDSVVFYQPTFNNARLININRLQQHAEKRPLKVSKGYEKRRFIKN